MKAGYRIAALAVLFLVVSFVMTQSETKEALAQTPEQPNVLFILTDDQDMESVTEMGTLRSQLSERGTTFVNAFVSTPACCPSRATFLRGQYAHSHGVLHNNPPHGGFESFHRQGLERSTVATWLHEEGYRTGYAGKYLNGYGEKKPTRYVPPGWDRWWGRIGGNSGDNYQINENGRIRTFDRTKLHDTDYYANKAESFIRAGGDAPWFFVVATSAPHNPAWAARRHEDMFRNAEMPKPPSFNEEDVSDKPSWVRRLPLLDARGVARVQSEWRQRQRSLQAVDDLVGDLVGALSDTDQLEETYVVYTSDNGHLLYRHRQDAKGAPYEESIGVPLIVRGPGVPAGAVREQLVSNTDWAPTIADWANVEPPILVDGRSFAPLLSDSPPAALRERLLFEFFADKREFYGIRTSDGQTYVQYETSEREYYDLATDPYQLDNSYPTLPSALAERFANDLAALKDCAGAGCQEAEDVP